MPEWDGEERRENDSGRREGDFSPQQKKILKRLADNQKFWDEAKARMVARGRWWAFVGSTLAAIIGGWLALKGLGIGITFGKDGQ